MRNRKKNRQEGENYVNDCKVKQGFARRSREREKKERGAREGREREETGKRVLFWSVPGRLAENSANVGQHRQAQMAGLPPPLLPVWGLGTAEEHRVRLTQILATVKLD